MWRSKSTNLPLLIAATLCVLSAFAFLRNDNIKKYSAQYVDGVRNQWHEGIRPWLKDGAGEPAHEDCKDPYRGPGYLYMPDDYRQTRWIPFGEDFLAAPALPAATYPPANDADVYFEPSRVEPQFTQSAPRQWMNDVLAEHQRRRMSVDANDGDLQHYHYVSKKDDGGMGWLWGRRVLVLGDSVDHFMAQFFCEEFGYRIRQPRPRTTATCEIPTFNLTLIYWHLSGSYTSTPSWWWMKDMKFVPFEERWEKLWKKTLGTHVRGLNGRSPDLLLWQSGLWDQRAMIENGMAHANVSYGAHVGEQERQLVWEEVRFITTRLRKLLSMLRDEFGNTPSMFRTVTIHRNSNATDANLLEIDRVQRALAQQAGQEIFEWGRIIQAFSMLYKDRTHTAKGAGSWLWSNMMLEYLRRSAGAGAAEGDKRDHYFDGWDACHERLVSWDGR
ncbi:hypothetical protein NA57DRAFT_78572 [Rhizodiscina lignyota]|uniref:Uncharacterized protein n=1 Tax=Rhizodiscina lignyota TaxID=1504668 RepID=A0A9P4IC18_9PEZI|nr:hypothetical protein NA57DRAFT_78572 [Rhizodiscina lignyota]